MEHRVPIVTRWTLYALGAVEGQRVRRPRDPVAAWLLRRHPKLLPAFAAPSILSMLRARACLVDRMIQDEVVRVRARRAKLSYWGFGGGFDARWHRMNNTFDGVVRTHCEVEEPDVMDFKNIALTQSTFAEHWERIHRVPIREDRWTVHDSGSEQTLVVLEGVAGRLGIPSLKRLLQRVRRDAQDARVVLDLPALLPSTPGGAASANLGHARWGNPKLTGAGAITATDFEKLGWKPIEDVWLAARPEVRAPSGMAICPGMEAMRVLKLEPY